MRQCVCEPAIKDGYPFIPWIGSVFGDCVYNTTDKISFYAGFVSLICYLLAMFPQFYHNYVRKDVDGLSMGLLVAWAIGDLLNWVGTELTNQLPIQRLSGFYFVLSDIAMIGQYLWYRYGYKRFHRYSSLAQDDEEEIVVQSPSTNLLAPVLLATSVSAFSRVFQTIQLPLCNEAPPLDPIREYGGSLTAWGSGLFYFFSRVPQVWENYTSKSVAGLSMILFILTISANVLYGIQILIRFPPIDTVFWATTFPYLLGSLGTLVFDFIVMFQLSLYSASNSVDQ